MKHPSDELKECSYCHEKEAYRYWIRGWLYRYCGACGRDELLQRPSREVLLKIMGDKQITLTGGCPEKPFGIERGN